MLESLECFVTAHTLNPNDPCTLAHVGIAYKEVDRIADAISLLYL
jgi:hypothetical protein